MVQSGSLRHGYYMVEKTDKQQVDWGAENPRFLVLLSYNEFTAHAPESLCECPWIFSGASTVGFEDVLACCCKLALLLAPGVLSSFDVASRDLEREGKGRKLLTRPSV